MKVKKLCAVICSAALCTAAFCQNAPAVYADEDASGVLSEQAAYVPSHTLSNPNADEAAMRTYDYICDNFGEFIISAQQESTWKNNNPDYEMDYIEENTGKLPAMRGLDFMNDDFDGVVKRAKEWHEKGGIVTICWHTGVNGKGYTESLNDDPDFDKLLTEGTPEYNAMIENWDKAAAALKELQDAGVPVLWRPFHEFDGRWFWWGKGGPENFKKLWQMMYDRYTNEFGLNNLIWVLGYSGEVTDGWYPGDEYCDVIGSDTYNDSRKTNKYAWDKLVDVTDADKPLAFHECGNLPTVEDFENDGCIWSWFMVWHTDFITGNDKTNLYDVYNSDRVITLDELPDLSVYPSESDPEPTDSDSDADSSDADSSDAGNSVTDSQTSTTESSAATSSANASSSSKAASATTSKSAGTATENPNTGAATVGISVFAVISAGLIAVRKKNK